MTARFENLIRSKAPPGIRHRFRFALLVVFFAASLLGVETARAEVAKEYRVKAAFLYNFTKFVEWQPDRFAGVDSPIVIGVLGNQPFGDELEKVVRERRVNGRSIKIVLLRSIDDAEAVHVLFVPSSEERRFHAARRDFPGVLTVGESERFADEFGVINFTVASDKVRFEINADAADRAGLKISAQLQKLATTVRKKS
jgi:hypothetical protein